MTTSTIPRIRINGVVDTAQNVMANINNIATNAQCWITWDTTLAKWRIIPNTPVTSINSLTFDDTTIVGGIGITGTGLDQLYNSAEVTFQNNDLRDDQDSIGIRLPLAQRYANENENTLNLTYTLINDPVHAQNLASIELLQGRLDKIISFNTDFSSSGLTAGEVIAVTAQSLGYVNKQFRVTTVEETDSDDGGIQFTITATEYDASVYSSSLQRDKRTKASDIIPFELNNCIQDSIKEDLLEKVGDADKVKYWYHLCEYDLGALNITSDTTGLYSQTDQVFFKSNIFDTLEELAIPAGFVLNDFDANSAQYRYDTGVLFTASRTGYYRFVNEIGTGASYNTSSNLTPEKTRFKSSIHIIKDGVRYNNFKSESTGWLYISPGRVSTDFYFNDIRHRTTMAMYLTKGESFEFVVRFKTDFGPSHPEIEEGCQIGWGASTTVWYQQDQFINYPDLFSAAP